VRVEEETEVEAKETPERIEMERRMVMADFFILASPCLLISLII